MTLNVFELLLLALARLPRFECDEKESGVGALDLREQRKVGDRNHALHAGSFQQSFADFLLGGIGALRRGSIRKLQRQKHVALILRRDETAGKSAADEKRQHRDYRQADHGDCRLMNEHVGGMHETLRGASEKFIEETKAFTKQAFFRFFVPRL